MRIAMLTATALAALWLPAAASAAAPAAAAVAPATQAPAIEQIRARCPPNTRYVRSHRDRRGRLIRGRCVPIRRR